MDKNAIATMTISFEESVRMKEGVEFWFARDLQRLLAYDDWRNFVNVIDKARIACATSGYDVKDHFVDVTKMVRLGSEAERGIDDVMLSRYACYLVAQNGDPKKEQIAFAQSYFAIQTRKQELIERRIALVERLNARQKLVASETELSRLIFERGVDSDGFARIRSKGDQALFGGITTSEMKGRLKIPSNRPMADFLPTITVTAKNLATEITNFNVGRDDIKGEMHITHEHVKNNVDVRSLLSKSGIKPEELPPEEDIRKLARRLKKDEKKIAHSPRRKNG